MDIAKISNRVPDIVNNMTNQILIDLGYEDVKTYQEARKIWKGFEDNYKNELIFNICEKFILEERDSYGNDMTTHRKEVDYPIIQIIPNHIEKELDKIYEDKVKKFL
jgi:hypothetical protein